ncbi:hypothetical protein EV662_10143 [Rhodovulum marinum]|uniref:Uncharacterized protein n=1 Tax=Rhodovulum marinum TaxID=320662 RepID=A0A4R2Q633_9RHOB|nr:hypothetical protein EV662_10143 [Rhodovulum marinum]
MATTSDGKTVIFRPYITTKDGRRIWAKWYGKKAFAIEVGPETNTTI